MFEFDVLEIGEDMEVIQKSTKTFYNLDNNSSLKDWLDEINGGEVIGTFVNDSHNVAKNTQSVYLTNGKLSNNLGRMDVTKNNLLRVMVGFSVRRMITSNWVNFYDSYLYPTEINELDMYDFLVYGLFNNKNNILSKTSNEFFWMSKDRMKELADENGYDNLYNDARTSSDRHVYNLLFGEERIYDKLSDDAKAVLDKATELVEQSMTLRQVMADDYNHLDSWDAGYAQLKLVWKEYFEEDFKEFRQLYKNLEDRMRPLVYELGFLMK